MRRLSSGRYGPLTVDEARDLAKGSGEIAKGSDHAEERRTRRHSATFEELTQAYLMLHGVL